MALQKLCRIYLLLPQTRGTWTISFLPFLPSRNTHKLKTPKGGKKTLSHSFLTLLGLVKGKDCSSGWSAAQQTTQEGSVAAHRQPHNTPLHSAMDFSSPGPSESSTTADRWLLAPPLCGPNMRTKFAFPCLQLPHLFTQLGWGTGMPLHGISWGNDLAWGSRADRRPALGVMCFTDMPHWKCLPSLLSHIYLVLKNLRAGKALGFILALSLLRSLKLWLQAELAMWLVSAAYDREQFPLGPDPHFHHHPPSWGFSQVLQSLLSLQEPQLEL